MTRTTDDDMLVERFSRIGHSEEQPSWNEVEERARALALLSRATQPRQRTWTRRVQRAALVPAAILAAILVAAPALGLPQRVSKLFSSGEAAPPRTQLSFSTLDRGAPQSLATGVIPATARRAFEVELSQGARGILWVAPTANGGFCEMLQLVDADGTSRGGSGPGCDNRRDATGYGVTIPGPVTPSGIQRGPVVVSGYATIAEAESAVIRFEDGTETKIALTWISAPIDAGFFVYGVAAANWESGRLPTSVRYVAADGHLVGDEHAIHLGPLASTRTPAEASSDRYPRSDDPCQVAQTCPSADASYRWGTTVSSGLTSPPPKKEWLCVKATSYTAAFRFTAKIRYRGLTYLCKR
jgi:hypothetical protein